jgi:hypothetical protein
MAALAQQQPATNVASQATLAISSMALELDQSRAVIIELRKQLADAQAKLKEQEAKPEEKK